MFPRVTIVVFGRFIDRNRRKNVVNLERALPRVLEEHTLNLAQNVFQDLIVIAEKNELFSREGM